MELKTTNFCATENEGRATTWKSSPFQAISWLLKLNRVATFFIF